MVSLRQHGCPDRPLSGADERVSDTLGLGVRILFLPQAPGAQAAGAESQLVALAPVGPRVKRDLTWLSNRLERKRGPRWLVSFSSPSMQASVSRACPHVTPADLL